MLRFITILVSIFCISQAVTAQAQSQPVTQQPNVVFILVDNTGWGDFSAFGGATPTPRIDEIANQGLKLTNYTVQAQCVPTRSAIMSGRLPSRSGTTRVPKIRGMKYGLAPWEYTLGEMFSDAGYQTALMGKLHLGDVAGRYPTDQGFDEWYGIANSSGEAGYAAHELFSQSGLQAPAIMQAKKGETPKVVQALDMDGKVYLDENIASRSVDFIERAAQSDEPFFLYVGFSHIHPPATLHPDFLDEHGQATYAGILAEMDKRTGDILDALKNAGIADNTIVIFSSDNATAPYGGLTTGSNGPFKGHFFNQPYEGSHRVAAMVRWPSMITAGTVSDEIITGLDWLPTMAGLISNQPLVPQDRPIDGIDVSSHLIGTNKESGRDHVLFHGIDGSLMSVKWEHFKVIFREVKERDRPVVKLQIPAMFNLRDDPKEENNLVYWRLEDAWITAPIGARIFRLKVSEQIYPNIKVGQDFTGYNSIATFFRREMVKFKLGDKFPEGL